MISTTAWIGKGRSARHPKKYSVDEAELERVSKLANVHFQDAKQQLEEAQKVAAGWNEDEVKDEGEEWEDDGESQDEQVDAADSDEEMKVDNNDNEKKEVDDADDLSRYNLDTYDQDESSTMGPFSNIKGLQFYRNNDEDPYITLKNDNMDEEEEREELEVLPGDNLLICAKTEDEVSLLEAYLYNSSDSNLYVHHDLMLPAFPLCLEWLDYKPAGVESADQNSVPAGQVGNYIAVGTMDPEIEIWSMDVVEGLFPDALLGRRDLTHDLGQAKGTGKKKRKQQKERIANPSYHVDAVLGLSWNRLARNLICSASADKTIKLWDLSQPAETSSESGGRGALRSFDNIHTDKVQSISWDTSGSAKGTIAQPARLLSGSYDKTLCVFDSRTPGEGVRAKVMADVECVKWNPWREHNFMASFEDGLVQSFDARVLSSSASQSTTKTLFTLSAHDGACTSMDISPHIPGCIATAGSDKVVKLWSVEEDAHVEVDPKVESKKKKSISMVTSRDLDAGKIFSANFSPDDPLTLAVAGSKGVLRIWDTLSNVGVRKTFGSRLRAMPKAININIDGDEPARGDGVMRLADEGLDSDDDDRPAYQGPGDEVMQE
jgi:periodic tryptophan protein 1